MSDKPFIEIDHVTFGYDSRRTILSDLSLTFARGKVTAVQFGGTTVLVDPSTGGTVYFNAAGVPQGSASGAAAVLEVKANGEYTLTVTGALGHVDTGISGVVPAPTTTAFWF